MWPFRNHTFCLFLLWLWLAEILGQSGKFAIFYCSAGVSEKLKWLVGHMCMIHASKDAVLMLDHSYWPWQMSTGFVTSKAKSDIRTVLTKQLGVNNKPLTIATSGTKSVEKDRTELDPVKLVHIPYVHREYIANLLKIVMDMARSIVCKVWGGLGLGGSQLRKGYFQCSTHFWILCDIL